MSDNKDVTNAVKVAESIFDSHLNKKPLRVGDGFVVKPSVSIRLDKLAASREAMKAVKDTSISLRDFINQNYHAYTKDNNTPVIRCTIKDIGLAPFEVDIYDCRMIVVEVTGKSRKDKDGVEVPERLYCGRFYNIGSVLTFISRRFSERKIMSRDSTVITLRDYVDSFTAYDNYLANVVRPEYAKALDAIQDNFPFTKISVEANDEEDWFK